MAVTDITLLFLLTPVFFIHLHPAANLQLKLSHFPCFGFIVHLFTDFPGS